MRDSLARRAHRVLVDQIPTFGAHDGAAGGIAPPASPSTATESLLRDAQAGQQERGGAQQHP
jgi:hypothetical protein